MAESFINVCPRDCFSSCRLKTTVDKGKIISLTGDPKDPYTHGALCAKGYTYRRSQDDPERILYPLKQEGKGSGRWRRLSWDEALGEIAERLARIKREEKTLLSVALDKYLGSTGLLNGTVDAFFRSLGPVTTIIGSPCEPAGVDALLLSYGACRKPDPEDMAKARLIFIWGANPAWTASQQMRYVYEARSRGAVLVVIDPQFSATAARGDLYVEVRPGGDGYLALGMAKVLWEEGLTDEKFLREASWGWEAYKEYVESLHWPDITEESGVSEPDIRDLARLFAGHKPATLWLGIGAQHHPSAGQSFRAIDALAALTGNIGIPGGNVHYALPAAAAEAGTFPALVFQTEVERGLRAEDGKNASRCIPTGRYRELAELDPALRFLWVAGRNPVAQNPESARVRDVLKQMETVVVVEQKMTATAALADYLLPAADFLEYEDVIVSTWHYGVALNQKALEPAGESRPDFWIVRELARKLNALSPGFSTFPIDLEAEDWLDRALKPYYSGWGMKHYRELAERPARLSLPAVPWRDRRFLTPSGKYEFYSQRAERLGVSPLPIPERRGKRSSVYPLQMLSVRSFAALNSQFGQLFHLLTGEGPKLLVHPDTARAKGIEDGGGACVYNDLGEICLPALYTRSVSPDLVVTFLGSQDGKEKGLNVLLNLRESDLGVLSSGAKGLSFQSCYVNLVRCVERG
ncbi:Molybdopterin oxidoreductase Fe4S4 domain protein [Acididesulfobacillus acetoxydans]|uniref:Molybdopterin oxidoreductase n=1 Tax=Acididesulfobacillus acetoxydans TaxID=1561005 RepID=A0A8S0Y3Z7_9FIRM|nr:molybdopterin-dependent oxidoreductase [Acididesulfobacillus acetoxydans]CAA7602595.1 Molybdopterin oxidoreductase Fe4S4 domain protein [Acididesulfobacillus acetoxydans]CEJ07258.1 Molybdopterin oxidoreductase [Acididesulfobacillus acetoxydans]